MLIHVNKSGPRYLIKSTFMIYVICYCVILYQNLPYKSYQYLVGWYTARHRMGAAAYGQQKYVLSSTL